MKTEWRLLFPSSVVVNIQVTGFSIKIEGRDVETKSGLGERLRQGRGSERENGD